MIWFALAAVLMAVYAGIILLAGVGWLIKSPAVSVPGTPGAVTVVVPFRNEAGRLLPLLESVLKQTVPVRLILVNDHSTDDSKIIIDRFCKTHPHLDVLVLENKGSGKKTAGITGLKAVQTPWVLMTDADCELLPGMGAQTAAFTATHRPGFFYGPVVYGNNGKRTNAVFFLDQLALNAVSLGLGSTGIHVYCSGACMGGDTALLLQAAPGQEMAKNLSGDDVTYLFSAVNKQQKILSLTERAFAVTTRQPAGLGEFLGQRLRWGQKASGYSRIAPLMLSVLVFTVCLLNIFVLIGCFSMILTGVWWVLPFIKLCIDLLFLFLVALRLGVSRYLWAFLPAWLLNLVYIPAVGIMGWLINPAWKGRKVKG